MQEEIEQKSFNIMISTTKLSARTVLRAVKAAFRLYQSKTSQGKQSVRTLLRQNRGVSSVEISKTGIRGLERYAKKYGIEILERRIQEAEAAEVNEMVRSAKVSPEQLAALLRQSATTTPNPAALAAVGATFDKEDDSDED